MKIKSKLLFAFTLLTLSSITLLYSCSKTNEGSTLGCDNKTENYPLTTLEKNQIPYRGHDTIRLVSNSGETIDCIGKGIQSFNTRDFVKHSNPACGPNGTEKLYGGNKFEFVDSLKNVIIQLENYRFYPDQPYKSSSIVAISFKNRKFFFLTNQISNPDAYNYVGDIEVRGINFLAVTKESLTGDTTNFLLLNKTNGIIKIQINQNETWELLKN